MLSVEVVRTALYIGLQNITTTIFNVFTTKIVWIFTYSDKFKTLSSVSMESYQINE